MTIPCRILITGAGGFIGCHVTELLLQDGRLVSVRWRDTTAAPKSGTCGIIPINLTWRCGSTILPISRGPNGQSRKIKMM
jgi:nucleoside-diphosphate-sugar epimerase